ncbi:MAG: carboxynorspermidine decarboxylase [Bacteroidota bacterium]
MKQTIPTPCYVLDLLQLESNLQTIASVQERAGVEIILAFKGFAMWSTFPLISKYVSGATASSLHEVKLCNEEMGVKAHTYCVAYDPKDFEEMVTNSSHLTFNSLGQYQRFIDQVPKEVSVGLRVNPGWSDVKTDLYNPSSPVTRLGMSAESLIDLPARVEGLHFHVLCESDSYALEKVLTAFEDKFGKWLPALKWINIGGGHLMTQADYDLDHLVEQLISFKKKHYVAIILEPGSAFAWQAGDLHTTILDVVENGGEKTAIFDGSFTCHMPDCLEMPYRPLLAEGSSIKVDGWYPYRLGGVSCLAGDYLDSYWFEHPLKVGDPLVFKDMMHYTMVKTTTFNGVRHPSIGIKRKDGGFELVREFGYQDFKRRLS